MQTHTRARTLVRQSRVGSCRFRSVVNELLAEKALAGQEGAVEALAGAAAQQQLRQAALAYVLLLHGGGDACPLPPQAAPQAAAAPPQHLHKHK
eukprot:XP_001697190.1 predicted protein [Chlamydomonas reinhardtii]